VSIETAPARRRAPGLADAARDDASLRRFLHGLPGVDQVGLERRSAGLATRSIKKGSKLQALDMAISMIDLTTLEGSDTPGRVRSLCAQARRPDPEHPDVPPVAAVCVYPDLAGVAAQALQGSGVQVAAVATAFPSGRSSRQVKLADTRLAVDAGAGEIDMVIDRGAWLTGRYGAVHDEIVAGEAGVRARPPEGHPGDRRARRVRRRPPRLLAGPAGRRRRDQDLDGQGLPRRHVARRAGDAAGRARLAPAHR
jgi:deoxyribose-phosphate aldolase